MTEEPLLLEMAPLPEARVVRMPGNWRHERPPRCCCGRRLAIDRGPGDDECCHGASHWSTRLCSPTWCGLLLCHTVDRNPRDMLAIEMAREMPRNADWTRERVSCMACLATSEGDRDGN